MTTLPAVHRSRAYGRVRVACVRRVPVRLACSMRTELPCSESSTRSASGLLTFLFEERLDVFGVDRRDVRRPPLLREERDELRGSVPVAHQRRRGLVLGLQRQPPGWSQRLDVGYTARHDLRHLNPFCFVAQ